MIQEGTVPLYVRLSPTLKARLQNYAARQDVSMNDLVSAIVFEYLEEHDPQEMKPRGK